MRAELYIEKALIRTLDLGDNIPNEIRIQSQTGYYPQLFNEQDAIEGRVILRIGVYQRREPIYPENMPPQFACRERPVGFKYVFDRFEEQYENIPRGTFDIGFMEPTKDVNLDKLKNRLRDNKNLKILLLNYYKK